MDSLQLLKKKGIRVEELPLDVQKQVAQYALSIEKVQEAESLELNEQDLNSLNEKKQWLTDINSEITDAINVFIVERDAKVTEVLPAKRGRKPKDKVVVAIDKKAPAKRDRKPKEEKFNDAVLEKEEPKKRGRKPKVETEVTNVTIVKEQSPVIKKRGRKTKVDVDTTSYNKEPVIDSKKGRNPVREKDSHIGKIIEFDEEQIIDVNRNKHYDIVDIEDFDDIEIDDYKEGGILLRDDKNAEEVAKLQNEIAGEFDKIEQSAAQKSKRKRNIFWGGLCVVGLVLAGIGGVNIIKGK